MSEKKSFILYDDMALPIKVLSDEEAGKLLKHIFAYRNNTNGLEPLEGGGAVAFQFIKQQLDRDSTKWETSAARSRENGSKGGRPPKRGNPVNPVGYFGNPDEPRKPVNVNVNVNATVKEDKNPDYIEMVDLLISRIEENNPKYFYGKNKELKRTNWYNDIRLIKEKDKRTIDEIRTVINWCQSDSFWKTNILSTAKLRKQFSALELQAKKITSNTSDYNQDAVIGAF